MSDNRDILSIDAAERRLISVVADESLKEIEVRETRSKTRGQRMWNFIHRLTIAGMVENTNAILETLETLQKFLAKKGQKVFPVGVSETKQLAFLPGHPILGEIYGMHPTETSRYYPISDFHRLNFESKYAEALSLLSRLGANRISVRYVQGWNLDFAASVGGEASGVELGVEAGRSKSSESSNFTEIHLQGHDDPELPEKLNWYPYEPIWEAVALSRIKDNAKNFKLVVSYNSDYGINASLNASIKDAGIKSEAKFTDQVNTTWSIEGDFGPKEKGSPVKQTPQ